jgi:hypothetical protein
MNRFQGLNAASLCSQAGRCDNPIPTRFLAPIDCLKIPELYSMDQISLVIWSMQYSVYCTYIFNIYFNICMHFRVYHGRRNFKDTNPLMSSLLVIIVWGGEAIL